MTKQELIEYWLITAERDFKSAKSFFKTKKYDWCLFAAHLMIEKVLKAFWVRDATKPVPYIHNLTKLAKETTLTLSEEHIQLLQEVQTFNILTRYPDYKFAFYKRCTKEFTSTWLQKSSELYQWLLSQIKSEQASQS